MSEHTGLADVEPPHVAQRPDEDEPIPAYLAYEQAATSWTRVARSFVRSLHAYREMTRDQAARRLACSARLTQGGVRTVVEIPAPPPETGSAPPEIRPVQVPGLAAAAAPKGRLTARQMEVAALIARGLSNEQIAQELVLTPGTVGNHIGHILRRLGARNRAQVAAWITQAGDQPGPVDGLALSAHSQGC
jgi:DNA-binding NarL/FixJ family response regulator